MKLHLGCGSQVVDGWINVDYALGARFMKVPLLRVFNRKLKLFRLDWNEKIVLHDLTKMFPWGDSSAEIIYTSHTLEHLSKEEGRKFLEECHRVLHKGGIIRVLVPDLRYIVDKYINNRIAADDFVEELGVLYTNKSQGFKRYLSPFVQFPHKCMYDTPRLKRILNELGFDSTSCSAFESRIDDIRLIELEDRAINAVVVEGTKL